LVIPSTKECYTLSKESLYVISAMEFDVILLSTSCKQGGWSHYTP